MSTPEITTSVPPAEALAPRSRASRVTPSPNVLARQQRDRLFDEAAKGMTPANAKAGAEDPLEQWAHQILRKHRQGFSAQQIVTMASTPEIGLKLNVRAIRRFIAKRTKQRAKDQ